MWLVFGLMLTLSVALTVVGSITLAPALIATCMEQLAPWGLVARDEGGTGTASYVGVMTACALVVACHCWVTASALLLVAATCFQGRARTLFANLMHFNNNNANYHPHPHADNDNGGGNGDGNDGAPFFSRVDLALSQKRTEELLCAILFLDCSIRQLTAVTSSASRPRTHHPPPPLQASASMRSVTGAAATTTPMTPTNGHNEDRRRRATMHHVFAHSQSLSALTVDHKDDGAANNNNNNNPNGGGGGGNLP